MHCDLCGQKKATVHLTEIVDDQMTEMHLCEECAREKSVQMEQQFGLADLLAGLSDFGKPAPQEEEVSLQCSHCGISYDDFKKFGRLGCGECYKSFQDYLGSLLRKIHGSSKHLGKSPKNVALTEKKKEGTKQGTTITDLKTQLQEAVLSEDFEKAAKLRDKIREMEKEGK